MRTIPTIHAFGPFRLDADAEILFRGSEPLPVGKRAVALRQADGNLEDWREAVGAFRRRVAETIARHDGFIARYRSNSVRVLFGWPMAHERRC